MKKLIICIFSLIAVAVTMVVKGEESTTQDNSTPNDSTIEVIGWFNKCDTVTYWVNKSEWNIKGTDTVKTASALMKVRINVTDSTADGYKMNYTFLEFPKNQTSDSTSALGKFKNQITTKLGNKIAGTTIEFETDEFGHISKYNNLEKIKKQAKTIFHMAIDELMKQPELQVLKENGFNLNNYTKNVDTDKLVESYLEELILLFLNHGQIYKIDEITEHFDATESDFEHSTYGNAYIDEDGDYHIVISVTTYVPQDKTSALIGNFSKAFTNDSLVQKINDAIDSQVKDGGSYEDYVKIDYINNGWPYSVVRQKITQIEDRKNLKQTVISLESYSFAQ